MKFCHRVCYINMRCIEHPCIHILAESCYTLSTNYKLELENFCACIGTVRTHIFQGVFICVFLPLVLCAVWKQ